VTKVPVTTFRFHLDILIHADIFDLVPLDVNCASRVRTEFDLSAIHGLHFAGDPVAVC
jgi:hypothetical protein